MNVVGLIVKVLPVISGRSAKGDWEKHTYIVATSGEHSKSIAVTVFGNKLPLLKGGDEVDFSINLSSREYNGKWFTEASAWSVNVISESTHVPVEYEKMKDDFTPSSEKSDDLPF